MTDLECSVNSCAYNCSNLCCRDGIKVGGREASKKTQTCCSSYEQKSSNDAYNSTVRNQVAAPETQVDCDACNCVYNKTGRCEADGICVDCCNCCDPTCVSETQCSTFKMSESRQKTSKNSAY